MSTQARDGPVYPKIKECHCLAGRAVLMQGLVLAGRNVTKYKLTLPFNSFHVLLHRDMNKKH